MSITIKDVVKYTGLSLGTISKYLNNKPVSEKNRVLIEEAIDKLGYKVNGFARSLKTKSSMTIGILIPDLGNIFAASTISVIEDILLQHGYSTILCNYKHNPDMERDKLHFLVDKMVDGIILMPSFVMQEEGISEIRNIIEQGIPVVIFDGHIKELDCDAVVVDNINAAYSAVEEFFMNGHIRVGIITGPQNVFTSQERLEGYYRVHKDYGVKIDKKIIKFGDFRMGSGYDLCKELLRENPDVTAIFVTNYRMTLGTISALNECGLSIPNEISVIGFDAIDISSILKPHLTVISQPTEEIGTAVANTLLKRIKGEYIDFPRLTRLKTESVRKDSVKNLKG